MAASESSCFIDMSGSPDDERDEANGNVVKSMRIGSGTTTNYKSGMKQIMQYFLQTKWKDYVLRDDDSSHPKFPYYLKLPLPLSAVKACFGYFATLAKSKERKRTKKGAKGGKKAEAKRRKKTGAKKKGVVLSVEDDDDEGEGRDDNECETDPDEEEGEGVFEERANRIRRYEESDEIVSEVTLNLDTALTENDFTEKFRLLPNMDKPTISYSGMSGYHR